jgi:hypothetical protein
MRGKIRILAGAAALILAALTLSGCFFKSETVGSGQSAATWHWGKLSRTFQADHERVWVATNAAVRDLKLKVATSDHDALVGHIRAYRSDDIAVRLDLDNVGKNQTRVVIWVGAIGRERDKQCAMAVMDAIDKKLGG